MALCPEVTEIAEQLQVETLKAVRSQKEGHEVLEEEILDHLNGGDQILDLWYCDAIDADLCEWTRFLRGKCYDCSQTRDGVAA